MRAVEDDFYHKAFGPAAGSLKRFHRRWESGQALNAPTLALAHRDLPEAGDALGCDTKSWQKPGRVPTPREIDVPPGDDNSVRSFEGPDDPIGYGTVRLIGIPNYFSLLPDQLLVPQETLRQ